MKNIFDTAARPQLADNEILVVAYISAAGIKKDPYEAKSFNHIFVGRTSCNFNHDNFAKSRPRQFGMGTHGYMIVKVNKAELEANGNMLYDPLTRKSVEVLAHSARYLYPPREFISLKVFEGDIFVDELGQQIQYPQDKPAAVFN